MPGSFHNVTITAAEINHSLHIRIPLGAVGALCFGVAGILHQMIPRKCPDSFHLSVYSLYLYTRPIGPLCLISTGKLGLEVGVL